MSRLQNKIAVVTGGSSGIGLATAKRFVDEGAYVFITGRRQSELDKAVAHIGRNVTAVRGDTAKIEDIDHLFEVVKVEKGVLDVLYVNAGDVQVVPLDNATPEHFDAMFGVNTRGLFFTVQKALPLMRSGGSIILNSSIAAMKGMPGYSAYSGSKAAVRTFARAWTQELKGRGIRVNTLSPGPVDTPIIDRQAPNSEIAAQMRAGLAAHVPLGRLGRPEELAAAALFLASDEASFVAGIDLQVDGGLAQV